MIGLDKIEEWVQEVEARPGSAANILRYISRRLRDLSERNEELLAENILLRSGKKVEEYENRIANPRVPAFELLKRQFNGDLSVEIAVQKELYSIIIYSSQGKVLRVELDVKDLSSGMTAAWFDRVDRQLDDTVRIFAASSQEELLLVFDSGRTVNLPVSAVPVNGKNLDWENCYIEDPHPGEELVCGPANCPDVAVFILPASEPAWLR
jgi:hypothetical protein